MRWFFTILMVTGLSACLIQEDGVTKWAPGVDLRPEIYCDAELDKIAKSADWQNAEVVSEQIKDGIYQEGLISMWNQKPYIIRVTNDDDGTRSFRSPEFFYAAAIQKVVYDKKEIASPCMESVTIEPGKTAEIHVVPVTQGRYDYFETGLWPTILTQITTNGSMGLIYVR